MSVMIATAPLCVGLTFACLASSWVGAQEPPVLLHMEWQRDDAGELSRDFVGMSRPFGHLFKETPESFYSLLPVNYWKSDPPSILSLILTGRSDVSTGIGVRRYYQLLKQQPDIEFLRRALSSPLEPSNRLARLDKLLALRFIAQQSVDGLIGAVYSLDREAEDPWIRRAARSITNDWQGKTSPIRPPAIPPRNLPEQFETLIYIVPPKVPDPAPLFAAFRRMAERYAQQKLRDQGVSFSPSQLGEFQEWIDLPQIRPYEVIRRFGLYQLDSFLYCTRKQGETQQFYLEAQGEFELSDLLEGLSREGLAATQAGEGSYTVSGSPWEFQVARDALRVRSQDYALTESKRQELDLRGSDTAAIALFDFESLSKSVPWLAPLGKTGSIRLSFGESHATIELRSDGDPTEFSRSFNGFCQQFDQRLETLLGDGFGRGTRSYLEWGTKLPWATRPLDPEPLLNLLQAVEVHEEENGLSATLSINSDQVDAVTRAWFTLVLDPEFLLYLVPQVQILPESTGDSDLEIECHLVNNSTETIWYRGDEDGLPSDYEIYWKEGGMEHESSRNGEWYQLLPGRELRFKHSMAPRTNDEFRLILLLYRWQNEGSFLARSTRIKSPR